MRRPYSRNTPAVVRDLAARGLRQALPWADYQRTVSVRVLLDRVLLVASLASS